ncbi:GNAT family N-acetyltransferase [Alkalihalobacterium chitinilyticum]|uniref:GNAT family N-acetyltransferase n=1 Tax=Alkalihalobacterium chitinilyticum TaxID=2980103 RepID=A0ABT5VJY6_9BACI|nr:GNAT family N-acetyltransferase [Alkalihalobacterium chitinilyticum]MDE5415047.1 GNAT family N-acetyltransferase [Alkalihalobacterium chitinilyticum]
MIEIRKANNEDQSEILKIYNETTLHLLKRKIKQWDYPWDAENIQKEIKKNEAYVVLLNRTLVGAFCISPIKKLSTITIDPEGVYLSKIAILPKFQGKNLGSEVVQFACSFARQQNLALYLDCWAGNEKLKEFYSDNSLEYIGDFPEEDYFISIFKHQ